MTLTLVWPLSLESLSMAVCCHVTSPKRALSKTRGMAWAPQEGLGPSAVSMKSTLFQTLLPTPPAAV